MKKPRPCTIELHQRADGRFGVYINGDVTAATPTAVRFRLVPSKDGKVIDKHAVMSAAERLRVRTALDELAKELIPLVRHVL